MTQKKSPAQLSTKDFSKSTYSTCKDKQNNSIDKIIENILIWLFFISVFISVFILTFEFSKLAAI